MPSEAALRAAFQRCNTRLTFEQAVANPALFICLRNAAAGRRRGQGRRAR